MASASPAGLALVQPTPTASPAPQLGSVVVDYAHQPIAPLTPVRASSEAMEEYTHERLSIPMRAPASAEASEDFAREWLTLPMRVPASTEALGDYAHEWLTIPRVCPHTISNAIAVAADAFNTTTADGADACCSFCLVQTRIRCRGWTFDHHTGRCDLTSLPMPTTAAASITSGVLMPLPHLLAPRPLEPSPLLEPSPPFELSPPFEPSPLLKPSPPFEPSPPLGFKPNVVLILTDDQDRVLGPTGYDGVGSVAAMPQLRARLIGQGSSLDAFYVNTPICCPSRTELFTGRYFHNVGPPRRPGDCMHVDTSTVTDPTMGLFGLLTAGGYRVGIFGKVTNDQERVLRELTAARAAHTIDSPLDFNNYRGRRYYRQGPDGVATVETLSASAPAFNTTYQTAQIGNRTLRWLGSVSSDASVPFFAYVGPHAPHFPAEPAPWHVGAFAAMAAPVTPNYNACSPTKPRHVAQNPPLSARVKCWQDAHFRDRWASLLAVDDLVGALMDTLEAVGAMQRTYLIYTSDHGYKLGQWRIGTSKQHPYETDVLVPFVIRGPQVPRGVSFNQITGNVDVLPTVLELAFGPAAVAGVNPDGRSLVPLLLSKGANAVDADADADDSTTAVLRRRRAVTLAGDTGAPRPWRHEFVNEYLSVGTYFNDHSPCWEAGNTTTVACGGAMPRGPDVHVRDRREAQAPACVESAVVGGGNCYFVDSVLSNSWRQLRVRNASHNLSYVEYDPKWKFKRGAQLQHYELYDLSADPYQLRNIYASAAPATRAWLHARLSDYFVCCGAECP